MQAKVVVTLLINGQWTWRAEAPIDPKFSRHMAKEELESIAKAAVDHIETVVTRAGSAAPAAEPVAGRERKRRRWTRDTGGQE